MSTSITSCCSIVHIHVEGGLLYHCNFLEDKAWLFLKCVPYVISSTSQAQDESHVYLLTALVSEHSFQNTEIVLEDV